MENEELKNKLIEKLEREVNEFKDTLRGLSADEIMDNSYKLTCIIEMKDYLIYNKELSKFELKTLLKREDILEECYDDWDDEWDDEDDECCCGDECCCTDEDVDKSVKVEPFNN